MTTPKIRTTVYSHKVIDVVKFDLYDDMELGVIRELMETLADNIASSNSGLVHIKIDRPLSNAEGQHRMGVVAKNLEKHQIRERFWGRRALEEERAEYERLKKKFES
jgi:hypothetical protein